MNTEERLRRISSDMRRLLIMTMIYILLILTLQSFAGL